MPTNTNTGYLLNPQTVMAPDLSVEQQQLQRRQALVDALRSQSLQPIDNTAGAASWTQGAAKLFQAFAANMAQKRLDKQNLTLAQAYADRLRGGVGHWSDQPIGTPGYGDGTPQGGVSSTATPGQRLGQAMSQKANPAPSAGPIMVNPVAVGGAAPPMLPPPVQPATPSPVATAPTPPLTPAAAPQDMSPALPSANPTPPAAPPPDVSPQPSAPHSWVPGPLALSGTPDDMVNMAMSPEKYFDARIAASAPVDTARTVQQAQAALARGDMATATALLGKVQHDNYIAPAIARGNSWTIHQDGTKDYNPGLPEGSEPIYDGQHRMVGVRTIDGVVKSISDIEGGRARARNSYEPIAGVDDNGRPIFTSKTDAATGGGGGTIRPGLSPGQAAAFDVSGRNSAQVFQQISDMGADVPNRLNALRQLQGLVANPNTILGPGSAAAAQLKGYLGTIAQSWGGGPPESVSNAAEFNKWAAQYSARTAQELGLNGSDARVQIAVHASPNGEMPRQALQAVIPQFVGMENAKQGYATAAVTWQQTHGPDSAQQFRTTWNHVFDPRLYAWAAEGPQSLTHHLGSLSRDDAVALRNKYLVLKQIGAFPQ